MNKILTLPRRIFKYASRNIVLVFYRLIISLPYFHFTKNTIHTQMPCTLSMWFMQKILGFNKRVYWPVHFSSKINQYKHIVVGVETCPGYHPGCYIQGIGKVYIGDYTRIATNVGIISSNHDLYDSRKYDLTSKVQIGSYCWLGMNSVILPNVFLGDFTIVAAGAIVTKSFPEGYCVIGGNPAKVIKYLDREKCVPYKNEPEYIGYLPKAKFEEYRKKNLWI